jgi:hypothetical protein
MRKPVLLKVLGVYKVRLTELWRFINSVENRCPRFDESGAVCYVTVLDSNIADGEKENPDPTYNLSLQIATEFGYHKRADDVGFDNGPTPREIMTKLFDILGVFPPGPSR